jgi:hypothetical protein
MVEVFKTNVEQPQHAAILVSALAERFPGFRINFDLQDCDRILRVEGEAIIYSSIIDLVINNGYACELLQ